MCKSESKSVGDSPPSTNYGSLPTQDPPGNPLELSQRQAPRKSFVDVHGCPTAQRKKLAVFLGGLAVVAGLVVAEGVWDSSKDEGTSAVESTVPPLSTASPSDLGLKSVARDEWNVPGKVWGQRLLGKGKGEKKKPLPTNSWYQNLLTQNSGKGSTEANQVYTVPYILDTVGPITGLRMHWPIMRAGMTNMQMVYDAVNGLTVGTDDKSVGRQYYVDEEVDTPSPLGVSLKWNNKGDGSMTTYIVRGMPYSTIKYEGGINPAISSGNGIKDALIDDGKAKLKCGEIGKDKSYSEDSAPVDVEGEIQLHFDNSDFTWIIFLSRPAKVQCAVAPEMGPGIIPETMFQMRIVNDSPEEPLYVRSAMLNQCTTGHSNIKGHCRVRAKWDDQEGYETLLREGAKIFAKNPSLVIDYSDADEDDVASVVFDWDAQTVDGGSAAAVTGGTEQLRSTKESSEAAELLSFALPHHQSILEPIDGVSSNSVTKHCIHTFHGSTCLVKGSKWSLSEDLGEHQSFFASRAPDADAIPKLAAAVVKDIKIRPSDNLSRAAADTYFSGKILARIGRVILIASELRELAWGDNGGEVKATTAREEESDERRTAAAEAVQGVALPSDEDIAASVSALKKAVQVWIDGKAEAEYVYDESWGGLVNCGCDYKGKGEHGKCANKFPDCPALTDVNLDFGNGFYMDHHFHYGYHIYAAAVVAKYDPEWGREFFDRVLLYVRDIANPSPADESFPIFRHKDWYLGSSWASGLISAGIPTPSHGRNQESSSEAIAAYEAIALFGDVMMDAFDEGGDSSQKENAKHVRDVGRLLTLMEVHAANRYWHVWNSTSHVNTYPPEYKEAVVGMMHETMASFQTWFAPEDFVSYGIQLLPFTPVSERRDDPEWASILYPAYKKSCFNEEDFCVDNGWTVVLSGLRATIGERKEALEDALSIPEDVFSSDGACGHSLSNTLWYIATRPNIVKSKESADQSKKEGSVPSAVAEAVGNS